LNIDSAKVTLLLGYTLQEKRKINYGTLSLVQDEAYIWKVNMYVLFGQNVVITVGSDIVVSDGTSLKVKPMF
jgi:hypothetical protein